MDGQSQNHENIAVDGQSQNHENITVDEKIKNHESITVDENKDKSVAYEKLFETRNMKYEISYSEKNFLRITEKDERRKGRQILYDNKENKEFKEYEEIWVKKELYESKEKNDKNCYVYKVLKKPNIVNKVADIYKIDIDNEIYYYQRRRS